MFLMILNEKEAAGNRQPAYRGWILGPRKRETQREPFAVAFGNMKMLILQSFFNDFG